MGMMNVMHFFIFIPVNDLFQMQAINITPA